MKINHFFLILYNNKTYFMNWIDYLPLAEKTLSNQFNCQDEFHQKLLHAVIGSLTEVEEILENYEDMELTTDVNKQGSVAEESADIFWYLSILFRELDIRNYSYDPSNDFKVNNPFNTLLSFTKVSLKFLDLLKKKIYYNKDISNEIMVDLSIKMHSLLKHYCYQYNTDVNDILEKNIAKLQKRYGDKFSSEKAINRDLESERKILENKTDLSDLSNFYLDGKNNDRGMDNDFSRVFLD
jgi:NTP pyrophosphatase (non-canonical NTP hydrolase)